MLDLHKQWVSDTVTENPYFAKCNRQALKVRALQEKAQELLQKRKCTQDISTQIRVAKQEYQKLEKKFFSMHDAKVANAHIMERKAWQDK